MNHHVRLLDLNGLRAYYVHSHITNSIAIDNSADVRYDVHLWSWAHQRFLLSEVTVVLNTNATSFRKDIFRLLEQTIKWGEPINISTKDGNAVVISEEDYNGLMETLYLSSMPDVKNVIIEGLNTPVSECIPENEVEW